MKLFSVARWLTLLAFVLPMTGCSGKASQPVEVGTVKWGRNLEKALATSKESSKPIFAFFQEVPG